MTKFSDHIAGTNKNGANGSPCLTPLLTENTYVGVPLTNTNVLDKEGHPEIQSLQHGAQPN